MKRRTVTMLLPPKKQKPEAALTLNTYILDDKKVTVRCSDYELWERWIDYPDERCLVKKNQFYDGTIVETKFLGFDIAPAPSLGPLLFETTVDGGEMHGFRGLHKTWEAAEDGHKEACHLVRETFI